jgi:hypothetical protein
VGSCASDAPLKSEEDLGICRGVVQLPHTAGAAAAIANRSGQLHKPRQGVPDRDIHLGAALQERQWRQG